MKILVGNNSLGTPGGSETYAFSLINELVRQGHIVEAITPVLGMVSKQVEKLGVIVHNKPISGEYDLLLMSHTTSIAMVENVKGFKVQTCHGIFSPYCRPVPGMNAYVAISEEVQSHLLEKGVVSVLIRNGVDCNKFKPTSINKKIKVVLSLAHDDIANIILLEACNRIQAELIYMTFARSPQRKRKWDTVPIFDRADLVVSLGRGAYEAMAAGKNVVVFDTRRYMKHYIDRNERSSNGIGDGLLTKENVQQSLKNNCSGRSLKKKLNVEKLVEEMSQYDVQHGSDLREFALENLNIEKQTRKYLQLLGV